MATMNDRDGALSRFSGRPDRLQQGFTVVTLIAVFLLGWVGVLAVLTVFVRAICRRAAGGRAAFRGRRLLAFGRWFVARLGRERRGELRRLAPVALRAVVLVLPVALLVHVPGAAYALLIGAFDPADPEAPAYAGLAAIACAAPVLRLLLVPAVRAALPASVRVRPVPRQIREDLAGSLVACSFVAAALLLLVGLPAYYGVSVFQLPALAMDEGEPEGAVVFIAFLVAAMTSCLLVMASRLAVESELRRIGGGVPCAPPPAAPSTTSTVVRHVSVPAVERRPPVSLDPWAAPAPPQAVDRGMPETFRPEAAPETVAPYVVASLVLALPLDWLGFALPYAVFVIRCCRIAAGRRVRQPIGDAVATVARWCWRKARGDRPQELARRGADLLRLFGAVVFLFVVQIFPGAFYLLPLIAPINPFVDAFGEAPAIVIGLLLGFCILPSAVRHGAFHVVHLALKRNLFAGPSFRDLRRANGAQLNLGSFGLAFVLGLLAVPLLGVPLLLGLGPLELACAAVGSGDPWAGTLRGAVVLILTAGLYTVVYLLSRRFFAGGVRDYLDVVRRYHAQRRRS